MSTSWKDNGFRSRKLWFAVFTILVLLVAFVYAAQHDAKGVFETFATHVVFVASTFIGGNVMSKWVSTKAPPPPQENSSSK